MNQESLDFLHNYCSFDDPECVWMLKGISRKKDNSQDMHSFFRRMILTKPDDIELCCKEMCEMANDPDTTYRIYVSLNSRNVVKALPNFQKMLIDLNSIKESEGTINKIKKIGSLWKTELEQRRNRGTKRFLLDIDETIIDIYPIIKHIDSSMLYVRRTVNGWAMVFNACDTRSLMDFCSRNNVDAQLHRDSMIFVEQFRGGTGW